MSKIGSNRTWQTFAHKQLQLSWMSIPCSLMLLNPWSTCHYFSLYWQHQVFHSVSLCTNQGFNAWKDHKPMGISRCYKFKMQCRIIVVKTTQTPMWHYITCVKIIYELALYEKVWNGAIELKIWPLALKKKVNKSTNITYAIII